ncbi:MAG: tetratricopeptide repeat protein [Bdellovibrionales bacterium]|nr:tetratricopeptide repeat protein [Bdellovibrionales bacterium]
MNKSVLLVLLSFLMSGCLLTRDQIQNQEERQVIQQQVGDLQKQRADNQAQLDEIEATQRSTMGRVEVLEKTMNDIKALEEDKNKQEQDVLNQKFVAYEQALKNLESQLISLNAEIEQMKAREVKVNKVKAEPVPKGNFGAGEYFFSKKQYDKAIENYDKYRKLNPNGRRFSTATYKMGLSFKELGMKEEAKVFFKEVISKFPKTAEAKKSQSVMSKL